MPGWACPSLVAIQSLLDTVTAPIQAAFNAVAPGVEALFGAFTLSFDARRAQRPTFGERRGGTRVVALFDTLAAGVEPLIYAFAARIEALIDAFAAIIGLAADGGQQAGESKDDE